ncbi:MAG: hypothetical protein ISS77_02405 [Phycisphaerae bacterium]|nr:hypothetical protein [Phycisphaerae bacterium]
MKKIYTLLLMVVLISSVAFSATKTVVRETKGQGINRDKAIKRALADAVAQVQGVQISSGDYEFGYSSATADVDYKKDDAGKKVGFDAVSVQTEGSVLKTQIAGLVKTYEVLNEKKLEDGTYEVTLKVWVYDYESPEQTKRLKLAVMPLKVLKKGYRFGNYVMPPDQMSAKMAQKLSVGISETNKFSVLDREYIQEFAHNRDIMVLADSSVEEKAKLSKVLGADYMIVGTISEARLDVKERTSDTLGVTVREYNADFVFDYRLIVAPTMQVKLADTVNIRLEETSDVKKLVKDWKPENLDYRELADNLVAKAANEVVKTIIDRLYPIRIATVNENGQIVINQGGKKIVKGLLLDVFSEGKEIIDFDTQESLGTTEIFVARIKVDKVMPKISFATIIEGELSKLSEGLICRSKEVEREKLKGRKSDIKRTSSGGVKLSFD